MAGHDDDGEQQQQQQHLVPEHDAQHTEHDGAGRGDGITDHVGADDAARTDTPLGVDGDMHGDNVALLTCSYFPPHVLGHRCHAEFCPC